MGTGILDMTTRCVNYGLPEPEFKMRDGFVATIYRKKELAFEKVIIESGGENIIEKVGEKEKTTEKTEKGTEKVTENQQRILDAVVQNPNITIDELSR